MSLDAVVGWCFVATWLVVLALILFLALPRVIGAGLTLVRHVLAIVKAASLEAEVTQAHNDATRLNRALDRLPDLATRAQAAWANIRSTPAIIPRVVRLADHIVTEYRAFRRGLRKRTPSSR